MEGETEGGREGMREGGKTYLHNGEEAGVEVVGLGVVGVEDGHLREGGRGKGGRAGGRSISTDTNTITSSSVPPSLPPSLPSSLLTLCVRPGMEKMGASKK